MKNKYLKIIKTKLLQTIRFVKEVSLPAAMTLEASIALPLFIFFFINIMAAFDIVRIQSEMEACLHQVGSETTKLAYDIRSGENALNVYDEGGINIAETGALSVYVISEVRKRLSPKIDNSKVMDGTGALHFISSKIMQGDDIVDIVVDYKVHPIISLIGFKGFPVESRFYAHAWTGYDIAQGTSAEQDQEEMVYVTEKGTVYHRDISCKHLNPGIKSNAFSDIKKLRNKSGAKYYACEYCGKGISGGNVFITPYGDRYHSKVDCPGLKRKIYTVPISEIGGKPPCSSCGH